MAAASIVRRVPLLALLLAGLSACSLFEPGRPSIGLSLAATMVAPGASVAVSVQNRSGRSWYGTSVCNNGVERRDGANWVPVYGTGCIGFIAAEEGGHQGRLSYILTEIPPRETVVMSWMLPLDAELGTHRVRVRLSSGADGGGDQYDFVSPTFEVRSNTLGVR